MGVPFLRLAILTRSSSGNVLFTVLQDTESLESDNGLTLSMQVIHLPLPELYRRAQRLMKTEPHQQEPQKYSWTELLSRVISGNLVYPWVHPISSDTKEKEL